MSEQEWIERAKELFNEASHALERKVYWLCCFLAQQSVEFYLKAVLSHFVGSYPFTHSLVALLEDLNTLEITKIPDEMFLVAEALEQHYTRARYPSRDFKKYNESDARRCLQNARKLSRFAEKVLEKTP